MSQHASEDVATWFPTYVAAADGANAYLDFGGYGSGQNLRCHDKNGTETSVGRVRWAFAVYGTEDYKWGFLFSESGSSLVPDAYSDGRFSQTVYFAHLKDTDNTKRLQTGRFRCDREIIDPTATRLTAGFHLVDFPIPAGDFHVRGVFDNLGNKGRQGGGRLCEVVLFSVDLSEAERVAVEHYLYRKWVDPTPEVNLAVGPAATVRLDDTPTVRLSVAGTLTKTGAGTLASAALDGREPTEPWRVRLEAGAVDSPRAVVLAQASAGDYAATTGRIVRTAATADATLTKTGDEELRVATLAEDVQTLDVRSGVLRLAAVARSAVDDLPSSLAGVIEDPSFEAFADQGIDPAASSGRQLDATSAIHGWQGTGVGSQKPYVVKWNEVGGNFNRVDVPFPDGDYAIVLHIDAGCQTTVTLPTAGVYRLSFWAAARPNAGGNRYFHGEFRVSVDGIGVAQVQTTTDVYRKYAFRLPYLAAGEHTLVFQSDSKNNKENSGLGLNLVCMFDDVQVDWLAADDPGAAVVNGGFELNGFQYRALVATNAVESWTVSETGDASAAYLVSADSPKLALGASTEVKAPEIPEGGRTLVLSGTPKLTGTAIFTQAGTYNLTFSLGGWWEKEKVTTLPTLGVKLGALLDATATVPLTSRYPTTVTLGSITVSEGDLNKAQTLEIAGQTAGAIAFLDDLRLVRTAAGGTTRIVNSFASDGWTKVEPPSDIHDGSGIVLWMNKDDVAWGSVRYDDVYRVGIRNRGAIHRTEHLTAGTYRLSVASIGRFFRYNDQPEELVQCYSDNRFEAWFGTTDGAVTNVIGQFGVGHAERWSQHTFLFTVPEDGDWLIGFRGLCESDASFDGQHVWSHGGLLDGLVIEPVAIAAPTPLREDLTIRVAKGAQLSLDAPTTNAVAEVRLGGRRRSGLITAERFPDFITGPGALEVPRRGAVIILR